MVLPVCCNDRRNIIYLITLGPFNDDALEIIRTNPHVHSVSEDGIMRISDIQYVAMRFK